MLLLFQTPRPANVEMTQRGPHISVQYIENILKKKDSFYSRIAGSIADTNLPDAICIGSKKGGTGKLYESKGWGFIRYVTYRHHNRTIPKSQIMGVNFSNCSSTAMGSVYFRSHQLIKKSNIAASILRHVVIPATNLINQHLDLKNRRPMPPTKRCVM